MRGSQIHPVWHPVLSRLLSPLIKSVPKLEDALVSEHGSCPSLQESLQLPVELQQTHPDWHAFLKDGQNDYKEFVRDNQEIVQLEQLYVPVVLHARYRPLMLYGKNYGFSRLYCFLYRLGQELLEICQLKKLVLTYQQLRYVLVRLVLDHDGPYYSNDLPYVQNESYAVQDYQYGCGGVYGLYGGQSRRVVENGLGVIPFQGDVGIPYRGERQDGLGTIHEYSRPVQEKYRHPYTGAVLDLDCATEEGYINQTFIGSYMVADIAVDEVNHYITDTGLVNKNSWIGFDELGNWPSLTGYNKLKACLRGTDINITHKRIRATANPGGPGHHAVKNYFIDHNSTGYEMITSPEGTTRMFVPAKVKDNKILMTADPLYVSRLREVGSPDLVRAWLEGDWNVITGAYFPEFSTMEHVISPFTVPKHWLRFMAGDWGSASPFSFHWFAVSDGTINVPDLRPPDAFSFKSERPPKLIPKGALIVYREFYGMVPGMINVGLRWPASRVAEGIKARTVPGEKITYRVMDPSAFKQDGGPSHAEVMARAGVFFRPADNTRLPGWGSVRERLTGIDADPDINNGVGTPMLYIFNTCVNLIRTLPALQHDAKNIEDCDTNGEDHAPDDLRYGCMSRPWVRPKPMPEPPAPRTLQEVTLNDLFEDRSNYMRVSYGN
jgi:hypothetical protein